MKKKNSKKTSQSNVKKEKPLNPFELRVNKVKYNVIGKRLPGTEKGRPGLSRDYADKKVNLYFIST